MAAMEEDNGEFYLRYYVGHRGKFGHEFLEFEFRPDGKLRYANNSNYKNDTMIRKEVFLTPAVLKECRRIISESEVLLSLTLPLFLKLFTSLVSLRVLSNFFGHVDYKIYNLAIAVNNFLFVY